MGSRGAKLHELEIEDNRNYIVTGQILDAEVLQGKSKKYYVFVIPIAEEVDLKAAARAVNEKSVEMIHVKDLTAITGYVRGGCSPLGAKKNYPVYLNETCRNYERIAISAGIRGQQLILSPDDLVKAVDAVVANLIR